MVYTLTSQIIHFFSYEYDVFYETAMKSCISWKGTSIPLPHLRFGCEHVHNVFEIVCSLYS